MARSTDKTKQFKCVIILIDCVVVELLLEYAAYSYIASDVYFLLYYPLLHVYLMYVFHSKFIIQTKHEFLSLVYGNYIPNVHVF